MYEGAETIIIWEFEFQRNAQSLINSWLLPFIILMFASNLVFVISESGIYPYILQFYYRKAKDRLGFLTTVGLSLMVLISMVSDLLPNAASSENEPLVNSLYKTSTSVFVVQLLVVVFTDQMKKFKAGPFWLKPKYVADSKQSNETGPLKDLILKLDEIKILLQEDGEQNQSKQYWETLAERINLFFCLILLVVDIAVVVHFLREVKTAQDVNWLTPG